MVVSLDLEEDDTVVDGEKESLAAAEEHIALVGQYNNVVQFAKRHSISQHPLTAGALAITQYRSHY